MKKTVIVFFTFVIFLTVCGFGMYFGYTHYAPKGEKTEAVETVVQASEVPKERTKSSTKLIYRYYGKDGDIIEEIGQKMPLYMIDKTEDEIGEKFGEWEIEKFSENTVVMKREIDDGGEYYNAAQYSMGEYQGNVALFYESGALLEKTNKPISSLPEEEREKILAGEKVKNKDGIIIFMENY
ncbi:MAG: hypothetical protein IJ736_07890, partial [Firmicutes bacterium]|nr:hypothetical protein [Bacillota bacterium]